MQPGVHNCSPTEILCYKCCGCHRLDTPEVQIDDVDDRDGLAVKVTPSCKKKTSTKMHQIHISLINVIGVYIFTYAVFTCAQVTNTQLM